MFKSLSLSADLSRQGKGKYAILKVEESRQAKIALKVLNNQPTQLQKASFENRVTYT